jgi:hypothetical protein
MDGNILLFPIDGPVDGLQLLLRHQLRRKGVLEEARRMYFRLEFNARSHKRWALGFYLTILLLSVVTITLSTVLNNMEGVSVLSEGLRYTSIVLPSLTALIVGISKRLNNASKFMVLKSCAESLLRKIYEYRLDGAFEKAEAPDEGGGQKKTHNSLDSIMRRDSAHHLAHAMEAINQTLMESEANMTGLIDPPPHEIFSEEQRIEKELRDDGLEPLSADSYIR